MKFIHVNYQKNRIYMYAVQNRSCILTIFANIHGKRLRYHPPDIV